MKKQFLLVLTLVTCLPHICDAMEQDTNNNNNIRYNVVEPQTKKMRSQSPKLIHNLAGPESKQEVQPSHNSTPDPLLANYLHLSKAEHNVPHYLHQFLPQLPLELNVKKEKQDGFIKQYLLNKDIVVPTANNNNNNAEHVIKYITSKDGALIAYVLNSNKTQIHIHNNQTNKHAAVNIDDIEQIDQLKFSEDNAFLVVAGKYPYLAAHNIFGSWCTYKIPLNAHLQNLTTKVEGAGSHSADTSIEGIATTPSNCSPIQLYKNQGSFMFCPNGLQTWSNASDFILCADFLTTDCIIAVCKKSIEHLRLERNRWEIRKSITLKNDKNNETFFAILNKEKTLAAILYGKRTIHAEKFFLISGAIIDVETGNALYNFEISRDYTQADQEQVTCAFIDDNNIMVQLPNAVSFWHFNDKQYPQQIYKLTCKEKTKIHYNHTLDTLYITNPKNSALSICGIQKYINALKSSPRENYSPEQMLFLQNLFKKIELCQKKPSKNQRTAEEQKMLTELTPLLLQWLRQHKDSLKFSDEDEHRFRSLILRPETQKK